jgi:hypothetical protein
MWYVHDDERGFAPRADDTVAFYDLSGRSFENLDLRRVTFAGCLLRGTSFRGSDLRDATFTGCFTPDQGEPVDMTARYSAGCSFDANHLRVRTQDHVDMKGQWPEEVSRLAQEMLSDDSRVRHEALDRWRLTHSVAGAYFMARLLADPAWEIRALLLQVLHDLMLSGRLVIEPVLLAWILICLGDEHSLVRHEASRFIPLCRPSREVLLPSLGRVRSVSPEAILAGLRASKNLVEARTIFGVSESLDDLVDWPAVMGLRDHPDPEVRAHVVALLGSLSEQGSTARSAIIAASADVHTAVRLAALQEMANLSPPPSPSVVLALLHDDSEQVRARALWALVQLLRADKPQLQQVLEGALADPSPLVVETARELLASHDGSESSI